MKSNIKLLKSIGIKIGTLIFGLMLFTYLLFQPSLLRETVLSFLSLSIAVTSVLAVLIDRFFWKKILTVLSKYKWIWTFFEQYECPILCEEYKCIIKYEWPEGNFLEKKATIKISQTYTSISINLYTDEIKSSSLVSEIVKENNEFVLYYTYITNPKAYFLNGNQGQYGGCKVVLDSITDKDANQAIEGIYWTTSKTKGDISLSRR